VHPQREDCCGSASPIGPRSVYDEAKRFAKAASFAFHRTHELEIRVARIFNTYGPRLRPGDGRVVSSFLAQALADQPESLRGWP
jgi:dTDP-glucose 4,6-dehydratase